MHISQFGPLESYYFQILEYPREYMNMDKIIFSPQENITGTIMFS